MDVGSPFLISIFELTVIDDKWDRVASIATVADDPDAFSLYVDGEAREYKNLAH